MRLQIVLLVRFRYSRMFCRQQVTDVVVPPRRSFNEFTGAEMLRCISSTFAQQVLVAAYLHCEETEGLKIFAGCSVMLRALHRFAFWLFI